MIKEWYSINGVEFLDSPALILYPDKIQNNLDHLINWVKGDFSRLRPHIKTHKCFHIIQLCMKAGISKFKCSTISEAEILGMAEAPDVLLAYQPVGPKLNRFRDLIKSYPKTQFSCLIDNPVTAENISRLGLENDLIIPVFLDLNIGMNRTGIAPGEEAKDLLLVSKRWKGIKIKGFHVYDGHIHDPSLKARKKGVEEVYSRLKHFKDIIPSFFSGLPIVIGGSPTFPLHAMEGKGECSPGTFIFWDFNYLNAFPEQGFKPAALVISRVISLLDKTRLCLDLGHKSVGSENPLKNRIYFLNAPELRILSQSEEHMVVEAHENHGFFLGQVLYGIPFHICPTVALYERAYIIVQNNYIGDWKIEARDRKINF